MEFNSVYDYIASQPEAMRSVLTQVRNAIRNAVPEAEEVISYHMPTYRLRGDRMLYFAGWKQHYALYGATKPMLAGLKRELAPFEVDKGTIRFPWSQIVPVELIGRIAKFRAQEIEERRRPNPDQPAKRRARP